MNKFKKNSKNLTFCTFLSLILILISFSSCIFVSAKVGPLLREKEPMEETTVSGEGRDKVLLIDISGVIADTDDSSFAELFLKESMVASVKEQLEKAKDDKKIKAIILRINSPGGTVTASDIIYNEINKFKEKNKVKVIACMMDLATSGGYFIAMASDKVIAHPTTITGSIGVIFENFNVEGLFDKIGIKDASIKSGDKKDIGSPFRKITKEEEEILQKLNNNLYSRFIEVVAKNRKELNLEEIKKLADGRIFSAEQALKEKLIDKIGYLEDAIETAKKETDIKEARVIMYKRPGTYKNNIYSKLPASQSINFNLLNLGGEKGVSSYLMPRFMYLWMPGQ